MIEKNDIIKMAKHVFRRSNGRQDHHIMHPYREWAIGVLVAITIFLVGGVLGLDRYLTYDEFVISDPVAQENQVMYRSKQVSDAIELYENRQAKFDSLVQSLPQIETEDIASTSEEKEVAEAVSSISQCTVDADCVMVTTDCSDCELAAIAAADQESFLAEKQTQCELNPPETMCDLAFEGEVKCIENTCQLVE